MNTTGTTGHIQHEEFKIELTGIIADLEDLQNIVRSKYDVDVEAGIADCQMTTGAKYETLTIGEQMFEHVANSVQLANTRVDVV